MAIDDHADLAARLKGVGVVNSRKTRGQGFQFLKASDVLLKRFATRAGTAGADRVGRGDKDGVGRFGSQVVVMPERGVDNLATLAVSLGQLGPDDRVAPFHLVVGRLADIVKQAASPPERAVETDLLGQKSRQESDFNRMAQDIL